MQITIETITPLQAAIWLNSNTNNRPLRQSLVTQYAKEMKNATWRLTHQGIAFSGDGVLLDGQHRLAAIVESGVAVTMVVTKGVDAKSQLVMDDHAKRSSGDALSLLRHEKITSADVAIIRAVTELSSDNRYRRMTKEELNSVYDIFRPALLYVANLFPSSEKGVSAAPVKAAIVLAWFYVPDLDKLNRFCEVLSGRQIASDDSQKAAILLREYMLKTGMVRNASRAEAFEKSQRAIAAFLNGQKLSKLYGTKEYAWPLKNPVRTLC